MSDKLDVVIVNWNAGPMLKRALDALAASDASSNILATVVVVDNNATNAGPDHSAPGVITQKSFPLEFIFNRENRGFAAACNQGAATGSAPYILFHNPDVEVHPGALEAAVQRLETGIQDKIGIVGIRLVDRDGTIHRCTTRFPTPAAMVGQVMGLDRIGVVQGVRSTDWDHAETREVDQVMGAFLMIRRDVFEVIGGFDERFFVYFDDVDLSLRAHRAGWKSLHLAEATAYHAEQGTTHAVKDIRLFYLLRSRLLYAAKHFGVLGNAAVWMATLLIEPLARGGLLIVARAPRSDLAALARGYGLLYRALPRLRRNARRPVERYRS